MFSCVLIWGMRESRKDSTRLADETVCFCLSLGLAGLMKSIIVRESSMV